VSATLERITSWEDERQLWGTDDPPHPHRHERVLPWVLAAGVLLVAGLLAVTVRPTAPPLEWVANPFVEFPDEVTARAEQVWDLRYRLRLASFLIPPLVMLATVLTARGRAFVRLLAGPYRHSPFWAAVLALGLAMTAHLATLPVAYVEHLHARAHGLGPGSTAAWLTYWFTSRITTWSVLALAAAAIVALVARYPRTWHLKVAVVGTLAVFLPQVVGPYLDGFSMAVREPVPDGPTAAAIDEVLDRAGIADVPVAVGEAAVGSHMTGVGPSQQVVLSPSLFDRFAPETAAVVVAHELAHFEHRDPLRGTLFLAVLLVPGVWVARRLIDAEPVRRTLGARGASDPRLVAVIAAVAVAGQVVITPAMSLNTRQSEAAAVHRSLELTRDPASKIELHRMLVTEGGADPDPPAWHEALFGTHPSQVARIQTAVEYADAQGIELDEQAITAGRR
jgi:STE24 endopeptidase